MYSVGHVGHWSDQTVVAAPNEQVFVQHLRVRVCADRWQCDQEKLTEAHDRGKGADISYSDRRHRNACVMARGQGRGQWAGTVGGQVGGASNSLHVHNSPSICECEERLYTGRWRYL